MLWLKKLVLLSKELSLPIVMNAATATEEEVKKQLKSLKLEAPITYKHFDDWHDFLILGRDVKADDIFILVSARKGCPSYNNVLPAIPAKLEKHFFDKSRIIIYP